MLSGQRYTESYFAWRTEGAVDITFMSSIVQGVQDEMAAKLRSNVYFDQDFCCTYCARTHMQALHFADSSCLI